MTNTVPQSSDGASSATIYSGPNAAMPPRRSSYASVAAGTAAASPQTQTPPSRAGAFSYLMNQNPASPTEPHTAESEQRPYNIRQASEIAGAPHGESNALNPLAKWGGMNFSNQYAFGGAYAVQNNMANGCNGFFVPTYLRQSKYMEKLEAAHKAKMISQKEAAQVQTNGNGVTLSKNSSSVSLHRMAPSHRGMTYEIKEREQPIVEDDSPAPLPSKWAELDRFGGLEIIADGLEVRYSGPLRTHDHEAAAARADNPMPPQCGIYYYEVSIISKGKEGYFK